MQSHPSRSVRRQLSALVLAAFASTSAFAAPSFLGVASGDATSSAAILWTRVNDGASAVAGLTAEWSTDSTFSSIAGSISALSSDAARDFTLKTEATGLLSATQYFYRFRATDNTTSGIGSFTTAPTAGTSAQVKFSFSGDADGLMRPYTLANNFGANQRRDFFVFLGDTIYETASNGSLAAAAPALGTSPGNLPTVLNDYYRKYREQFQGVTASGVPTTVGQQGLSALYAAQGNYTLLDNHELGNKQYINGGAPQAALSLSGNGAKATDLVAGQKMDVNTTGAYVNQTAGYKTFVQAYTDYQPIRVATVSAPTDARSDGTQKLYSSQEWGKNLTFVNVDDRSYRDVRLKDAAGADDVPFQGAGGTNSGSNRWADPNRTMVGATQLSWLKSSLLGAEQNGQVWKVVAVSSPIDQAGRDGGKSWFGGYQAERNDLLKYIDDNNIDNVVFLSTDDHFSRVNELFYDDNGTRKRMKSAFSIVTGPIGATGPDGVTDHSFANIASLSAAQTALLATEGAGPLGLKDFGARVTNVRRARDGVITAGSVNDAVNFYSPDTFAYTDFTIDADGVLHVSVKGINSYATNTFPSSSTLPTEIFGFDLAPVPEPETYAMMFAGLGVVLLATRRRRQREGSIA